MASMETIWTYMNIYMETWGTHAAQLHEHDAEMSTCNCDSPMALWGPDAWAAGGQFFFKARPEKEATHQIATHQTPKTVENWCRVILVYVHMVSIYAILDFHKISIYNSIFTIYFRTTGFRRRSPDLDILLSCVRSPQLRHADPEVDQSLGLRRSDGAGWPGSRGAWTVGAMLNTWIYGWDEWTPASLSISAMGSAGWVAKGVAKNSVATGVAKRLKSPGRKVWLGWTKKYWEES